MARSRFCRICKGFHDLDQAWPSDCVGHFAPPSAGAGEARFYVQSDTVEAFKSMADGRMYDSKSRYRADLKSAGYIEVGNENRTAKPPPPVDRASIRQTIKDTYRQLGG